MIQKLKKPGDRLPLILLSWAHALLLFGGIYLVLAAFLALPPALAAYYLRLALWLIVPITASWLFIRHIRVFALYLLCSAAVTALVWRASSFALTGALCAVIFIIRGYVRIKKGRIRRAMQEMAGDTGARLDAELWEIPTFLDEPHPAHWAVFCAYYVMILFSKCHYLLNWMFFLLAAEIFVCFIYRYLSRMWTYIRENRRIANLPVNAIQKVGRILLLLSLIFLILAVLPAVLYQREPLADMLESMRLKPLNISPWEELYPEGMTLPQDMGLDFPAEAVGEPPAWLMFLSDMLVYLATVAAALALLAAIYRLCRRAAGYFAQEENDEIVFIGEETRKAVSEESSSALRKREGWASPNRRIRRHYKKTLRRQMKTEPSGWETPQELEEMASLSGQERDALHRLYEKARYSREGCGADEVKAALSSYK